MTTPLLHRRSSWPLLAACLLCIPALALSQEAQEDQREARPAELRNGEMIVISIEGLVAPGIETRLLRRIGGEGEIWLPLLDEQPVIVRNMTQGQLQAEIRRAYLRRNVDLAIVAVARVEAGEDQQLVLPPPQDQQLPRR